jgi:hypothetical protein
MKIRRRLIPIAIAAAIMAALPVAIAFAASAPASGGSQSPSASASVVKVERVVPARKKVVHRRFRPWSHPTRGQVREIIANEARRWGVSAASLSRRVSCESHYNWYASNGQYQGVLQFAPGTFYRGMRTIRDRRIKIVRRKSRIVHVARVTHYSDGHKERRRTTPRRQTLVVTYTARLPRSPSVSNTFAQIRIGAQAIRGISAVHSSEWSCGA